MGRPVKRDQILTNTMHRLTANILLVVLMWACAHLVTLSTAWATSSSEGAWDERAKQHRVKASLLALTPVKNNRLRVGVLLEPDEKWHVYWKNSGESGLSTAINWEATFADGSTWRSEEMSWPVPEVFVTGGGAITTFGYDDVLHTVEIPLPAKWDRMQPVKVRARVNYLTCKVECIPGDQELLLEVAPDTTALPEIQARFEKHDVRVPYEVGPKKQAYEVSTRLAPDELRVGSSGTWRIELGYCHEGKGEVVCWSMKPDVSDGVKHVFLPELVEGVKLEVEDVQVDVGPLKRIIVDVGWRVTATRASDEPVTLAGIIRTKSVEGGPDGAIRITSTHDLLGPAEDVEPRAADERASSSGGLQDASKGTEPVPAEEAPVSLLHALWLAFVGGLLLNVMPCVFPVLSIKAAGVAQIAHHSRAQMIRHGLAYAGGILSAMGALALAVILMRQAGVEAGWGFQFQSPLFLLGLIGGLTLFAVNLFGAFDIGTPMGAQVHDVLSRGDEQNRGALRQSFLEGLMCVLLATPCSAPFMGTAVGFALASHGVVVAAIFLMLGVGLALPFVALCALPGWAKLLPKPGPWLDVLKHVLGWCLLVTCVWLLWLLGQGQGADGMAIALLWMCGLAGAGGIYGLVQYRSGASKWGVILALVFAVAVGFWASAGQMREVTSSGGVSEVVEGERWKAFDEEAIREDVAAGKIVFVDFTADWCITCKVNENGALQDEELLGDAERMGVVWYKADWTHRDDKIRAILKKHGKGGVPMYLIYGKNAPVDGLLLPELLTVELIREGFEQVR